MATHESLMLPDMQERIVGPLRLSLVSRSSAYALTLGLLIGGSVFTEQHATAQTRTSSSQQQPSSADQTPPAQQAPAQPTPSSGAPATKPTTPTTQQSAPPAGAQAPAQPTTTQVKPTPTSPENAASSPTGVTAPTDYVIGPDDVLQIVFWREKDLSSEVIVRPDGKISLSLLNDVQAAGLTPEQLRQQVTAAASRYVTDPSVTVVVKTINSRKVFVTGMVNKPGTYALNDQMTVLQMLAVAGGLGEFAKAEEIVVMRAEGGETKSYKFNYKDVRRGKNLQQNITLRPGDTIVVP